MPAQREWFEKDYYKVLGVPDTATEKEITRAYRKLAKQYHPDANPGAEDRFKEISAAYDVLGESAKRKEYDEVRRLGPMGGGGPGGGFTSFRVEDLGDLFGGLFGQNGQTRTRTSTTRGPRRGSDVEGEVTVDFTDSIQGVTVPMQMVSDAACDACHGTGAKAGTVPKVCTTCEGSGMQTSAAGGVFAVTEPCRDCRGRGMVVEDPCPICHGSGRARSTRTMQVRIPAGVTDGQRIRLKGKGGAGENGGAAGDLYVVVHVSPHAIFGRKADNLTLTAPVTFNEAALGAEIEVPTLDGGPVKLRVPQGTPNGRTFRVRGKGVTKRDAGKGDLLVTVEVVVPQSLTEQAREALTSYGEAVGAGNPRARLFARTS